jgi:hypothetical protein
MTCTGQIRNGIIVLDEGIVLPEGAKVRVEVMKNDGEELAPLAASLLQWAGKGVELPADLAQNHDHYLHGQPKK